MGEREVMGKDWEEWKEGTCSQDEVYERRIKKKSNENEIRCWKPV